MSENSKTFFFAIATLFSTVAAACSAFATFQLWRLSEHQINHAINQIAYDFSVICKGDDFGLSIVQIDGNQYFLRSVEVTPVFTKIDDHKSEIGAPIVKSLISTQRMHRVEDSIGPLSRDCKIPFGPGAYYISKIKTDICNLNDARCDDKGLQLSALKLAYSIHDNKRTTVVNLQ